MKLLPYLTFDGNGRDALEFYAGALGGEVVFSQTFGDMPDQPDWVTDANRDRLANGVVQVGDSVLMASDTAGQEPFAGHTGMSINIAMDDLDRARTVFEALSEGGEVRMPFAETFWAKGFGLVEDRFGVSWMVNCDA